MALSSITKLSKYPATEKHLILISENRKDIPCFKKQQDVKCSDTDQK